MDCKKVLLSGLLFFFYINFNLLANNVPIIKSISISPENNRVELKWQYNFIDTSFKFFRITYYKPETDSYSIDTSWSPTINERYYSFDFPRVNNRSYQFIIAPSTNGKISDSDGSKRTRTLYTTTQYDTCNNKIIINWTKYVGWDNLEYTVLRLVNGKLEPVPAKLSSQDTVFEFKSLAQNTEYTFLVQAQNTDDPSLISYSNKTTLKTINEIPPKYIIATNSEFIEPQQMSLHFEMDVLANVKNFRLMKSDSLNGTYSVIQSFINFQNSKLDYTDVLKSKTPAYYRLQNYGTCKTTLKESNAVTAVILDGDLIDNQSKLQWNKYHEWFQGMQQYNILRAIGNEPFHKISNVSSSLTDYSDDILKLQGQQLSGNICYKIESESFSDTAGMQYTNQSSQKCFDLSSLIFIPQAFTPNGDGQNDEYKPAFAFAPNEYHLLIYNRAGAKVFETSDYNKGWDGTVLFGQKTDPGVYVYFISFKTNSGNKIEKKGTISVIYP